jgi:hypothetical protein
MSYIHGNARYPFFDAYRIPCQPDQEVSVVYPELSAALLSHFFPKFVVVKTRYTLRRGIVLQDIPGDLDFYMPHYHFEFGEYHEDELLELIEQGSPFSDVPLPRIG